MTTPTPQQILALAEKLERITAELRHAYRQGAEGNIKNQHAFVRGLLGPQIEALETETATLRALASPATPATEGQKET